MQDPDLAIRQLDRCIRDLGLRGALVNGFSQVGDPDTIVYYDLPQYRPFWAAWSGSMFRSICTRAIRSRVTPASMTDPWLMGPTWALGQETAVHALRLMGSGLFDEHPNLSVVLGHMGEGLPFSMWRVDKCLGRDRHNYPASAGAAPGLVRLISLPESDNLSKAN